MVAEKRVALEPNEAGPCYSLEKSFSFLSCKMRKVIIYPQWVVTKIKIC